MLLGDRRPCILAVVFCIVQFFYRAALFVLNDDDEEEDDDKTLNHLKLRTTQPEFTLCTAPASTVIM